MHQVSIRERGVDSTMEDITQSLALTLGVGWASGINLYAAILVLGYLGLTGRMAPVFKPFGTSTFTSTLLAGPSPLF